MSNAIPDVILAQNFSGYYRYAVPPRSVAVLRLFLLVSLIFIAAVFANAQDLAGVEQGIKPYGSYEGGNIDSVSTVNGNITLHIPLLTYPQRGGSLHASFSLVYQNPRLQPWAAQCANHVCHQTGYNLVYGQPNFLTYNQAINPVADFVPLVQAVLTGTGCCPNGIKYYSATDADGATHDLGQTSENNYNNYLAVDTTGFLFTPQSTNQTNGYGVQTDRSVVSYTTTASSAQFSDTNGNLITATSTGWTDTMGRPLPAPTTTTSTSISKCPSSTPSATSATLWSPPGPNGTTLQYTFCWATITVNFTTPQCSSNCQQTGHTTQNEMVGMVLPNLTTWSFSFDSFGELTSITLPTGGTISYAWTFVSGGCYGPQYIDPVSGVDTFLWPYGRAVTSRTVNANDGTGPHTWNYAVNSTFTQTIVTAPPDSNGVRNDTVHNNTMLGNTCSIYETELDRYSGSHTSGTLLQKTTTNYSYSPGGGSVGFGNIVLSVVPTSVTTIDETSGMESGVAKTYDSGVSIYSGTWGGVALYGDVLTENDYDFGSGSLGNLLRQTNTQYMALSGPNASYYLANNLLDLPYTTQVNNGNGQMAYTTYGYDESGLQSSGVTEQKTTGVSYPGNQTSVHRSLNGSTANTTNCAAVTTGYLVSNKVFYDTGEVQQSTDPCTYPTTFQYSSNYYGAFPTTITNALNQSTNYAYDPNTGAVTSITDPNSQPTYMTYDNSMGRLTQVSYPDGGSTKYCYTDGLPSNCPSGDAGSAPFAVVITKAITSSTNKISTATLDGLARLSQTQLNSDSPSTTNTLTTYDALGRKSQVYNPTRCSTITTNCGETTWGFTTYNYDALNRVTSAAEPDGSSVTTTYDQTNANSTGLCTTVKDEAGKARQSCMDGLGRMTGVWEDDLPPRN